MTALELRIPPPVVALIIGAAMWALSLVAPPLAVRGPLSTSLAIALALAGVGASLAFPRLHVAPEGARAAAVPPAERGAPAPREGRAAP